MSVLAVATAVGMVLALLGPFGSYLNPGIVARFGYWIGCMWLGLALYGGVHLLAKRVGTGWRRGLALIVGGLAVSVPQATATRELAFALWPRLAEIGPSWPTWFGQTASLGLSSLVVMAIFDGRAERTVKPERAVPSRPPVPQIRGGEVLALQMEDHYVRVHAAHGSELLLMPLTQAMDMTRSEGLRVHRSWWVARQAVVAVEGPPRAMRLTLSNGITAPVARSAVARLRAAGWIETGALPAESRPISDL